MLFCGARCIWATMPLRPVCVRNWAPSLEALGPINLSNWRDARFFARVANNRLQRPNWTDIGAGVWPTSRRRTRPRILQRWRRCGVSSSGRAKSRSASVWRPMAKANTQPPQRHAMRSNLQKGDHTNALKSRSTRLITTALLVARDGDDELLATHDGWVRQVISTALEEQSDLAAVRRLRCNRPAIPTLALIHLWARNPNLRFIRCASGEHRMFWTTVPVDRQYFCRA